MTAESRHFPFVRDIKIVSANGEEVPVWTAFPRDFGDWLYVGLFKHGEVFQEANLQSLLSTLRQVCGTHSCRHGVIVNQASELLYSVVIIQELPEVMAVAADLMDTHDAHEHISDEHYWQLADCHLQRMWAGLSIPARIDFVKRTKTPPAVVLESYISSSIHEDLWTMLYQEMGL